jgi:membrane-associated protease RseP (regulator of RpoE activity)
MLNEQYANEANLVICPSCRAALTAGLRFCRMCGYRLGEGSEEYNETRRFDGVAPPVAGTAPGAGGPAVAQGPWAAAPIQPAAPLAPTPTNIWGFGRGARVCSSLRMGWMGWLILSLAITFIIGGGVKLMRGDRAGRAGARQQQQIAVSILDEVDGFETADGGGVFIEGLDGPDTSIERAGMIGGDIITSFDGQAFRDESALRRVLAGIPPGKAVPVVFIRDGETRTTTLPTAHRREYRGMRVIDGRPGGRGQFGVDPGGRVRLPESNTYGVKLDGVNRNGPADLAGLKRGDVVIEINGKPVRTPGDLRLRIYEAVPGSMAAVVVMRDGQRLEISVKVGRSRDN